MRPRGPEGAVAGGAAVGGDAAGEGAVDGVAGAAGGAGVPVAGCADTGVAALATAMAASVIARIPMRVMTMISPPTPPSCILRIIAGRVNGLHCRAVEFCWSHSPLLGKSDLQAHAQRIERRIQNEAQPLTVFKTKRMSFF
jgi:hypothetical protein